MADETDKERADRLELECEELTEQIHTLRRAVETFTTKVAHEFGFTVIRNG